MEIKVLDHGFVRLRNIAGPTRRLHQLYDADDTDAPNAARMSFDATDSGRTKEQDMKLAAYLMRAKHSSPFEQVQVWLEMKLPIFVARQFVRHRTCLAGDTKLIFQRPVDGKAYPYQIKDFVSAFEDPAQTKRLKNMQLRYLSAEGGVKVTKVKDAWRSGRKEVFKLVTAGGFSITASKDHRIRVPQGYATVGELTQGAPVICVKIVDSAPEPFMPQISEEEFAAEEWRAVPNTAGYEVSNLGRVRSYVGQGRRSVDMSKPPKLKKQTLTWDRFVVNIEKRAWHVSTLVALAFLGPRPEGAQVLHADDNEWDNRVSNLRYGSQKENSADKLKNGSTRSLRAVEDYVKSITSLGEQETYDIAVEAEEENFVANGVVVHNCRLNETSGRYITLPADWYIPETVGGKAPNVKQGQADNLTVEQQGKFKTALQKHCSQGYAAYLEAMADGVAPEHARMLLSLNHYTHWLWNQDLHNLMHFLSLRDHSHAQVEAQAYAKAIDTLIRAVLPETMKLYDEFRRMQ